MILMALKGVKQDGLGTFDTECDMLSFVSCSFVLLYFSLPQSNLALINLYSQKRRSDLLILFLNCHV